MIDAFKPVRDLEAAVAAYTGAPYAVAVNSCTAALLLACAWHLRGPKRKPPDEKFSVWAEDEIGPYRTPAIEIPKRTYISVPMSIVHAGGVPIFRDEDWRGAYQLKPYPIFDSARWFTSNMCSAGATQQTFVRKLSGQPAFFGPGSFVCLSFHAQKTLGHEQGGAILHDNPEADAWLRRARFDGRTEGVAPKDDTFTQIGWHAYMSPTTAAGLLWKLSYLPKHNEPLPNDDYPDLSTLAIFR